MPLIDRSRGVGVNRGRRPGIPSGRAGRRGAHAGRRGNTGGCGVIRVRRQSGSCGIVFRHCTRPLHRNPGGLPHAIPRSPSFRTARRGLRRPLRPHRHAGHLRRPTPGRPRSPRGAHAPHLDGGRLLAHRGRLRRGCRGLREAPGAPAGGTRPRRGMRLREPRDPRRAVRGRRHRPRHRPQPAGCRSREQRQAGPRDSLRRR